MLSGHSVNVSFLVLILKSMMCSVFTIHVKYFQTENLEVSFLA
jgi:hypothetical protein